MKQITLIVLAALVVAPALAATTTTMYKWTDKNGVVHYSDQPHPGAKKVELPGLTGMAPPSAPTANGGEAATAAKPYNKLAVTSPAPKATLHANDGKVPVTVTVDPPLRRGDTIVYALDGKHIGNSRAMSITLTHVARGTHTLNVSIVAGDGKTVAQAPPVTFYVRHQSVLHQQNPAFHFPNGTHRSGAFNFPRGKNPP
ncbi:MAG TPA: DUF4124 domain-containing protein [Gammaproteobacteria bacterium]|nr:DUF4124 domain-containing protein [Gammaproteobacteria bacterium]